ncbi:MAG: hypothetical protein ABIU54_14780 [Candidatus Eisenbacteria bacterium]
MFQYSARLRPLRLLLPFAGMLLAMLAANASSGEDDRGLDDLLARPGTRKVVRPSLMRADLWMGLDRRMQLDSVVYALANGARTCRVLGVDSLWAVDYTWVYPHTGLPSRWYNADELFHVGDSLALSEATKVVVTFGTCRIGVRAHNFQEARREAERLRPPVMPARLVGRLKLKLERAHNVLIGKPDHVPGDALGH